MATRPLALQYTPFAICEKNYLCQKQATATEHAGTNGAFTLFSRPRRTLAGRRPGKRWSGASATRRRTRRGRCGCLRVQRRRKRDCEHGAALAAESSSAPLQPPFGRPAARALQSGAECGPERVPERGPEHAGGPLARWVDAGPGLSTVPECRGVCAHALPRQGPPCKCCIAARRPRVGWQPPSPARSCPAHRCPGSPSTAPRSRGFWVRASSA